VRDLNGTYDKKEHNLNYSISKRRSRRSVLDVESAS